MFKWITLVSFAAVFIGILLHYLLFPCGYKAQFSAKSLIRKNVHLLILLFLKQKLSLLQKIRKVFFVITLFSFLVLLLTGFSPVLMGYKLQGYELMIHVTFAPIFIGCVAVIALLGAGKYRFNKTDVDMAPWNNRQRQKKGCWTTDSGIGVKAGFWLLLIISLPVTLTMVLSMLPLFGTKGQEFLYHMHRWSALVFGLIVIVELYMLIRMDICEEFE